MDGDDWMKNITKKIVGKKGVPKDPMEEVRQRMVRMNVKQTLKEAVLNELKTTSLNEIIEKKFPMIVSQMHEHPELLENKDIALDEINNYLNNRFEKKKLHNGIKSNIFRFMGIITATVGATGLIVALYTGITMIPKAIILGICGTAGLFLLWTGYRVGLEIPEDDKRELEYIRTKLKEKEQIYLNK